MRQEEQFKSHFAPKEENTLDETKTKKIQKGESRCEQRIKNRMAAQQSRERHRQYVEEL